MTDDNIANILILLKTHPDKFYEKNYDKETLKKIKEIIKVSFDSEEGLLDFLKTI